MDVRYTFWPISAVAETEERIWRLHSEVAWTLAFVNQFVRDKDRFGNH